MVSQTEGTRRKIGYQSCDSRITPLNTSLCKRLDDVKELELLNPLEKKNLIVVPPNAKMYYKYHWNYTHDTNECITLKNEIKDLIHKGHLH